MLVEVTELRYRDIWDDTFMENRRFFYPEEHKVELDLEHVCTSGQENITILVSTNPLLLEKKLVTRLTTVAGAVFYILEPK